MRPSGFLIAAIAFSWTAATVRGQTTQENELARAAALPTLFQVSLAPEAAYGAFRRDALMKFAPVENLFAFGSADPQKKPKPQPVSEPVQRPPIDPSMVGYIDDALIHTQIRVRFDAALHDYTPDRAEFFYAKCGCYRAINDPKSPGPGSEVADIPNYVNFQQLNIYGEYAYKGRYSFFGVVPIRWLQPSPSTLPDFSSSSGISDIQIGTKVSPFASETHFLTFQLASHLATGDSREGLGTHHATLEPMVLYFQKLGERGTLEAEFGDTHPLGSSWLASGTGPGFAGDVMTYGVGGSYQLDHSEGVHVAGVLEMVGWHILGGNVTDVRATSANTDGVNIVNLKVGPRVSIAEHHSVYFGYGIALTSATWYHEIFRTEYRYTF
jgi:hypothetical protein